MSYRGNARPVDFEDVESELTIPLLSNQRLF